MQQTTFKLIGSDNNVPVLLPSLGHLNKNNSRRWNTWMISKYGYSSFCKLSYLFLRNLSEYALFTPDHPGYRIAFSDEEKFMQTNVKCAQKQNTRYGVSRLTYICQVIPELAATITRCIVMGGYPGSLCGSLQQRKFIMKQDDKAISSRIYHMIGAKLNKSDIMLIIVVFGYILLRAFRMPTSHLLYSNLEHFCEWFTRTYFLGTNLIRPSIPQQIVPRQIFPNALNKLIKDTTLYFKLIDVRWPITRDNWTSIGMTEHGISTFNTFIHGLISFDTYKASMCASDLYHVGCAIGTMFFTLPKVEKICQDNRSSYIVFCMHCRTINSAVNVTNKRVKDKLTPLVNLETNTIVCNVCQYETCSVVQMAGNVVTFPTAAIPWKSDTSIMQICPTTKIMCTRCCRTTDISNSICKTCIEFSTHNPICHYHQPTFKKRAEIVHSVCTGNRHLVLCTKHRNQVLDNQHVTGQCA